MKPKDSSEYKQFPFNPELAFTVDGKRTRYLAHPLDETYTCDPEQFYAQGSLPPEECEVRDHLKMTAVLRSKVTRTAYLWSLLMEPTYWFKAYKEPDERMAKLCTRSMEHRSAFLRLSKSESLSPPTRVHLKKIVRRADLKLI